VVETRYWTFLCASREDENPTVGGRSKRVSILFSRGAEEHADRERRCLLMELLLVIIILLLLFGGFRFSRR
jgi:hypothetical protein